MVKKKRTSLLVRGLEGKNFRWQPTLLAAPGPSQREKLNSFFIADDAAIRMAQLTSGLSRNQFAEYWQAIRERRDKLPILPPQLFKGDTITIKNLALSCSANEDTIALTWPLIKPILGVAPSTLLRILFLDLLRKNHLLTGGVFHKEKVKGLVEWCPYGWKHGRPLVLKKNPKRVLAAFPFLVLGMKSEARVRVEIRLTVNDAEVVRKALPVVMQYLHHDSHADFFRLLYISFLRFHLVVNEIGYLRRDWKKKFARIDLQKFLADGGL